MNSLAMSLLFVLFSFTLFDAGFVQMLLNNDTTAWEQLCDETRPPEQDLDTLSDLAHKLAHWVPKSIIAEQAVRLEGHVTSFVVYGNVSHCTMLFADGQTAGIFVPAVPSAWNTGPPVQKRAAAFGMYIKTHNGIPVFVAPNIEWFPDTWLGNLGFDVALLDHVPVSRVIHLEHHDEETNRRAFKFTEADAMPFYALLRTISATSAGWLEDEAKKQDAGMPFGVIDLFNRPGETRGKPMLLHGTAKRIIPTPVLDREVQALFGIEHYYQIYLFTDESRGNPIVVCVGSLPEGMPTGDADNFAERITIAAVPYKLWIYETPGEPHYAPVLIGREPIWHPKPSPPSSGTLAGFSFTAFLVLVCLWFAVRLWAQGCRRKRVPNPNPTS